MNDQDSCLLRVSHLYKNYCQNGEDTEVLSDLSFRLAKGEIVSIVGPSGCGKSTLMHLLAGFDRDYRGEVVFSEQKITGPSTDRCLVFQNPQLFSWLKVKDNISFGLKRKRMEKEEIEFRTQTLLSRIGMLDFQGYYPEQISGGMQQRVALARSLIMMPKLMLMDEPFSALDYQSRLEMQRLTLRLWDEYKPSMLFVTHDIEEAILMSDRIIVLSKRPGKIISELSVVFERPRGISLIKNFEFHQMKADILDLLFNKSIF